MGRPVWLRLEITWGLEGQVKDVAVYPKGSGEPRRAMKRMGRVRAAFRNELEMISAGFREATVTANPGGVLVGARRPPPRALEGWAGCRKQPPVPFPGGSGLSSQGMGPLHRFQCVSCHLTGVLTEKSVRAGLDTPRSLPALTGLGSSLPALFWS